MIIIVLFSYPSNLCGLIIFLNDIEEWR